MTLYDWLVVGPLKNMKVNWDDDIPNICENKIHVPNHQPDDNDDNPITDFTTGYIWDYPHADSLLTRQYAVYKWTTEGCHCSTVNLNGIIQNHPPDFGG